jgi:hypothetical protein
VLEDSTIVSEIAFTDTDTGSAVIGQFVGEHGKNKWQKIKENKIKKTLK